MKHDYQIAVDAAGITVTEKGHGVFRASRSKSFPWDEMDAVMFLPRTQSEYVQSSGDVGREIAAGIQVGLRMVDEGEEAMRRDIAASDIDPAFLAHAYQVVFMRRYKDVGERVNLERGWCALLAQAIEYFAPIDLMWFPHVGPEKVQLSAKAHPVSLDRRTLIESIVDRYAGSIRDERVFFRPAIPPDKLSRALERFAAGVSPDAALVLVDDTWRKSGQEGVLLTAACLYGKVARWPSPHAVPLGDIESVDVEKKGSRVLVINDAKFQVLLLTKQETVGQLVCMLQEIVALHTAVVTPDDATG